MEAADNHSMSDDDLSIEDVAACSSEPSLADVHGLTCPLQAEILNSIGTRTGDVEYFLNISQRCADGTAHPAWIKARRNRLTASRFAAACGVKGAKKSVKDVVAEMLTLPEARPKQAARFGVQHEARARSEYIRRRQETACSVSGMSLIVEVREVGLCVMRGTPWLAGSPDGVCWENGIPSGLLEVKTAPNWSELFEEDPPADWIYQLQGCMRVASSALDTQMSWCDLFLWTPARSECRRIAFDSQLWEERMFPLLHAFYFTRFLPAAAERLQSSKARGRKQAKSHGRRQRQKRKHK